MTHRPTSMAQMRALTADFVTDISYAKGLAYRPQPTDVFISPYSKCGTTWMQQIVHGLRTGGDMEFGEISEVVPWLELAHDLHQDLQAQQKTGPHAFKSHLNFHQIPKGGRYIVVLRDPVDAMRSLFRFLEGWFFERGSIPIHEFADYFLEREDTHNYWVHAASWWEQRDDPSVLLLSYEGMTADLPSTVARVAEFLQITDPAVIEIATRQASFDFMKAHSAQFEEKLTKRYRDPALGLPAGGPTCKVATGQIGRGSSFITREMLARYDTRWSETMGHAFGVLSYSALRAVLRA